MVAHGLRYWIVRVLQWFVGITFAIAFLFIITGSPVHKYSDLLFWFMTANAFGLTFLAVLLHHEPRKDERDGFIRLFVLADWLFVMSMAAYAVWKSMHAGTFW